MFSLKGNSSPYANKFIYVPFAVEETFACPINSRIQRISIKNKALIFEFCKNNFNNRKALFQTKKIIIIHSDSLYEIAANISS